MVLRLEALRERLAKLEEVIGRLRGLGGFRNVLVHGYVEIDPEKVYAALQRSAADFTDFEAEILAWLDRRSV